MRKKKNVTNRGKYSADLPKYDYALRNAMYIQVLQEVQVIYAILTRKNNMQEVVNQQISNLFSKNGISLSKQADLTFSIDPYTYQLTVSGNADRDTLSQIEKLLNEGDNAKYLDTCGFVCMIQTMKLLIRKQQIGQRRTNILYGMKCMRQQGMMHAMRHIEWYFYCRGWHRFTCLVLRQRLKMAQVMNFILIDGWNMLRMAGKKKFIRK